jgi:hypothetical protein
VSANRLRVAYVGEPGTERTQDFADFLGNRFAQVAVHDLAALGSLDLSDVDVMVVDAEVDLMELWAPQLPARLRLEDFPIPTVLVGALGGQVGDKLGLKIARAYGCVCLKESAIAGETWHQHAIFEGPFDVPVVEPRVVPTPTYMRRGDKAALVDDTVAVVDLHTPVSRAAFEGTPELTAAQERGDTDTVRALLREGSPIGLVSNPAGLLDSPDCEWILGGINSKAADYVAVGRHGHFLMWGFGAQPSAMTPVGAALFCNAVAYVAGFAGAQCEALRVSQSRELLRSNLDYMPPDMPLTDLALELRPELASTVAEACEKWGELRGFLRFVGPPAKGKFVLDEELLALGLANDDPKLPVVLAEQLDAPQETGERARTLWRRYLRRDASDVAAERDWLSAQQTLFFSDWAGYRWISRTDLPHLNPPRLERHSSGVVNGLGHAHRDADGAITAIVRLEVIDGYYIYPPGSEEGLGLRVSVAPDSSLHVHGSPVVTSTDEHITSTEIHLTLHGPGDELELDIVSQACNAQECLVPTTLRLACAITSD